MSHNLNLINVQFNHKACGITRLYLVCAYSYLHATRICRSNSAVFLKNMFASHYNSIFMNSQFFNDKKNLVHPESVSNKTIQITVKCKFLKISGIIDWYIIIRFKLTNLVDLLAFERVFVVITIFLHSFIYQTQKELSYQYFTFVVNRIITREAKCLNNGFFIDKFLLSNS